MSLETGSVFDCYGPHSILMLKNWFSQIVLGSTVTVFLQLPKCLTLPFPKETSLCSRDKVLCPHRVQGWACWSASSRTPEGSRTSLLSLWLIFLPLLSFFSLLFSPSLFLSSKSKTLCTWATWPLGGEKKSENLRGLQRLKGFKS